MNKMRVAATVAAAWLMAGSVAFADVQISLQDGRVTVVAKDATVRQILTEWARIGQTTIVNVERIPGGPITLELTNVPEQEALDVLLRSLSGYMAAPRANASSGISHFDRIVVMPTSAPPRAPVSAAAPPPTFTQPQPQFVQPQFQPPPPDEDSDDEPPAPAVPVPTPRGPVFNTFPAPPQPVNPQGNPAGGPGVYPQQPQMPGQQPQPATTPNLPFGGVAVPGMVAPPQQQPGQQQPVVVGQPPRRPGGPEGPDGPESQ
jgi:hypothetical protein